MAETTLPAGQFSAPSRTSRWRGLDWVIETLLLFAAAYFAQPFLESRLGDISFSISASIYWVPVLLLSAHYGLLSGLVSVLVASGLYVFEGGLPPPHLQESVLDYSLRAWTEPLLWLLAAAVLGTFRTRERDRIAGLHEKLRTEARTVQIVNDRYGILRRRVESLERALAVGQAPVLRKTGLMLAELTEADAQTTIDRIYVLLGAATGGGDVDIFLTDGSDRYYVQSSRGPMFALGRHAPAPAMTAIIPDPDGEAMFEVDLVKVDPDSFGPADRAHIQSLCTKIGAVLVERGLDDIVAQILAHQAIAR